MHEILSKCDGALDFTAISVDYSFSSKICETPIGYRIKMNCALDHKSRKIIEEISEKHNLKIDINKENVVIY
jgi:hypothetical protein